RLERFVILPVFSPHRLASSSTGRASAVRPRRSKEKTSRILQWNAEGGVPYEFLIKALPKLVLTVRVL
ncbi:MAG: hypothetical protein IJT03_01290, partial [Clostridia bacterium]|nr:hypothetical protein [Clostridia bacterium]